jgi:hypothetical protein
MALVFLPAALSPLVFWFGLLLSAICLVVVLREGNGRRIAGAFMLAAVLAAPMLVINCEDRCIAIECWWHCLANLTGESK